MYGGDKTEDMNEGMGEGKDEIMVEDVARSSRWERARREWEMESVRTWVIRRAWERKRTRLKEWSLTRERARAAEGEDDDMVEGVDCEAEGMGEAKKG